MRRKTIATVLLGLPLSGAVVVVASRVGATARFVTWPIVGLCVLAAVVALIGLWFSIDTPRLLAGGALLGLVGTYFLLGAPVWVIGAVLVGVATLGVIAGGLLPGLALAAGAMVVLGVVTEGAAVECGESSVTMGAPWWTDAQSSAHGSASDATGDFGGTVDVGNRTYTYRCAGGRLASFERSQS